MPNYDPETGIHYGVIQANNVGQSWWDNSVAEYPCESCEDRGDEEEGCNGDCSPDYFEYKEDGYRAIQDGTATEIVITKSPYYTFTHVCSPCFPNAGDLDTPEEDGIKTYCFGHDWFDGDVAPYHVYRVDNDEEVDFV